jgi:hypothetical protein
MKLELTAIVSRHETPIPNTENVNRSVVLAIQPSPALPDGVVHVTFSNLTEETFNKFKAGEKVPVVIG